MYTKAQVLDRRSSLDAMVKKLGDIPLLYQPGTRWMYSISIDVLGRLVEVVSGSALDDFFANRIFKPLDMKDTGFYVPEEKWPRFAAVYGPNAGGGLRRTESTEDSPFRFKPGLLSGGGGLTSTARDYLRFCQMIANGGNLNGERLLCKETVLEMTKDQLPKQAFPISFGPIRREGVGFGLGFSVQASKPGALGPERIGEIGWGGAASTHFWISPHDQLVVIALQQYMPFSTRLEQTVKPLVYESIIEP
jgi:CubicO group peptidase (beta-lactamase class C family)